MSKSPARRLAALEAAEKERARRRYYIQFNYKPRLTYVAPNGRLAYVKAVWPKLFLTYELAWAYMQAHPIFANAEAQHNRPRLMSASVEMVRLKEKPTS